MIADLDAALLEDGETVIVRRYTAPSGDPRPRIDFPVKASVRPLRATELVGAIDQTGSRVIVSPTGLSGLLPLRKGDRIVIQGRERTIELPKPIAVRDAVVRIELLVTG